MRLFLPLVLTLGFISCQKQDQPSTEELLTNTWHLQKTTLVSPVTGTSFEGKTAESFVFDDCFTGSSQTFSANGDFLHEHNDKCQYELKATWNYQPDEKVINVHYIQGFEDFKYHLVSVSPTTLKVQRWENFSTDHSLLFQYEFSTY